MSQCGQYSSLWSLSVDSTPIHGLHVHTSLQTHAHPCGSTSCISYRRRSSRSSGGEGGRPLPDGIRRSRTIFGLCVSITGARARAGSAPTAGRADGDLGVEDVLAAESQRRSRGGGAMRVRPVCVPHVAVRGDGVTIVPVVGGGCRVQRGSAMALVPERGRLTRNVCGVPVGERKCGDVSHTRSPNSNSHSFRSHVTHEPLATAFHSFPVLF